MNTQQQAYIEGFVKRASQYGFNYNEAIELLKQAALTADQHKLDVNHNGKIEASDLKALRNRKKTVKTAGPVPEMDTQPGGMTASRAANNPVRNTAQAPAPGVSAASKADSLKYRLPIPTGGTTEPRK